MRSQDNWLSGFSVEYTKKVLTLGSFNLGRLRDKLSIVFLDL